MMTLYPDESPPGDARQTARRLFVCLLGFAVVIDPAATKSLYSRGEFHWGGAASTAFWVDPAEQVTVTFFTQLLPSSTYPIRTQLRQLVYQALVG